MAMKENIIYCDKCHFEWNNKDTKIETIVLNEKDDVRMRYFQCPECGAEYIVDVTDRELRGKIAVYKRMNKKYIRMFNARESQTRLRNYGQRMENVHDELVAAERELRRRYIRAE